MRSHLVLGLGSLLLVSSSGCMTWDVQQRSHTLKIVTDPPGASVWQTDSAGNRRIGTGPTEIKRDYQVKVGKSNHLCWIGAAAAVGVSVFSVYKMTSNSGSSDSTAADYNPDYNSNKLWGILGTSLGGTMALTLIPACLALESNTQEVAMQTPEVVKISASAEGLRDQEMTVMLPGPQKEIHLSLRPGTSGELLARNRSGVGGLGISGQSSSAKSDTAPAAGAFVSGAPQPASYALIVGIERYRDVPSPTGARADAESFARVVRTTLGVPEANVKVALDDRATRSDIEKQLEWMQANVQPGGRVYFYFSGHGAPDASAGTPYLLPYDGDPKFLTRTALPLAGVLKTLGETKARDVLAVVDSCFSGAGGRSVLPDGARPLVRVKEASVAPRLALLTASSGAEISGPAPDGNGGLFTRYVNEGLGRGQADINGDGQISLQELSEWVRPRVARDAKRDNRDQTPSMQIGSGLAGGASSFIIAQGIAGR